METAVQLICFDETGKLQTHSDGLKALRNIPDDYTIESVSMVGDGRIGKSSLLNQIAGKNVFEVGSTTTRVTRGIWIYVKHDPTCKRAYMYCDVEGFGDPLKENGKTADERLLIIVSLICNMIVFNIKGVYDSELLQKLEFTCVLVEKFRKKNKVISNPGLIVVLRDFDLDPPESPDDELRQLFRSNQKIPISFRSVKAFQLVRPAERKQLRNLKDLSDSELDSDFVKERSRLQEYLKSEAKPLCSQAVQFISGKVLVELIQDAIKVVNNEELEDITQTLPVLLRQYNQRYTEAALNSYEKQATSNWPSTTAPETVQTCVLEWKRKIKDDLQAKLFDVGVSVYEILNDFEAGTQKIFDRLSEDKCETELVTISSTIKTKLENSAYIAKGGHEAFLVDKRKVETDYHQLNNLGQKAKSVWEIYETKLQHMEKMIKDSEEILFSKGESTIGTKTAAFLGAVLASALTSFFKGKMP